MEDISFPDSNTTLVKVKLFLAFGLVLHQNHSNTTLVKVKSGSSQKLGMSSIFKYNSC